MQDTAERLPKAVLDSMTDDERAAYDQEVAELDAALADIELIGQAAEKRDLTGDEVGSALNRLQSFFKAQRSKLESR